ncbi:hypothetical protein EVAR_103255_1 [Eumeta japonica]|uniref:Rap-GAP domain-containing protein n=1 Tax=Eumeta variegata TaxID=151549 RepID=A0A4C1YD20_EUMVA|nr:hypothetical protein EVAR_103255_1 [Eumeta japonica]
MSRSNLEGRREVGPVPVPPRDKVRLRGWNRFRGGLDVKGDMTGSHSIYTMHQGHEIMFHVSTMLPFSKDNKQQLERKRHIGNDIVNIVFTEDSAHNTFNPHALTQKGRRKRARPQLNMTNDQAASTVRADIFAVVSEVEAEGYRLSVYSDDSVPPFGPSLPCPPIFNDPQLFREFYPFQTPTFALKRQRTLDTLIRDIYADHCADHKVPMLSRRTFGGVVWQRRHERRRRRAHRTFLHVGRALKLDAVLRGDAPTSLVSTGCGGARRVPWEGRMWRAAPLPAAPLCADQLAEGRLLLSTTSNTYILEGYTPVNAGIRELLFHHDNVLRSALKTRDFLSSIPVNLCHFSYTPDWYRKVEQREWYYDGKVACAQPALQNAQVYFEWARVPPPAAVRRQRAAPACTHYPWPRFAQALGPCVLCKTASNNACQELKLLITSMF